MMPPLYPLLIVAVALFTFSPLCQATCSSFSPIVNPYNNELVYTSTGRTSMVSAAVNCSGPNLGSQPLSSLQQRCNDTTCSLAISLEYQVRVNSSLNVSISSDTDLRNIFDLAKLNVSQLNSNVAPTDLNITMVHKFTSISTCLRNGTAGYWAFTPTLNCVQGVFQGCIGASSTLDGLPITLCGAKMLDSSYKEFDGDLNIVSTDDVPLSGERAPPNATMTGINPRPTRSAARMGRNRLHVLVTVGMAILALIL